MKRIGSILMTGRYLIRSMMNENKRADGEDLFVVL